MRKLNRFLCLLLCLLLTCSAALAADSALPEKMNRQIKIGSGVRGALTLAVAGSSNWLDVLLPFTGSEMQVRYITKDGRFEGKLYAVDDQEQERALTQIYGDETHLYLRSELLPDTVLSLPIGGALMDTLFVSNGQNPTFYSVVQKLMAISSEDWESKWNPVLARYESALEQWLTGYAAEPSISQAENGSSSMTLRYVIPADALKAAMKDLMSQFLNDSELVELMHPMLTDAQQAVYLNPAIGYYYDAVIDKLPLQGDLSMLRTLSTQGDMLGTTFVMPLPENPNGWTSLTCELTASDTILTLVGDGHSITLITQETSVSDSSSSWNGIFRYLPEKGAAISAAFTLTKQRTVSVDAEDGRQHEKTDWTLNAKRDLSHLTADDAAREDYADFEDIALTLSTHYSSRELDNNPTTLEISLTAQLPKLSLDLQTALRTTTPWALSELSSEGSEPVLRMSPERISELLGKFSRNAALTMTSLSAQPAAPTTVPDAAEDDEPSADPTFVPPAH